MQALTTQKVRSGLASLDELLQGLRPGDNVVWQVDNLEDYPYFAQAFAEQATRDGLDCIYLRFAPHTAILEPRPGLTITRIDPSPGFDYFTSEVLRQRLLLTRRPVMPFAFWIKPKRQEKYPKKRRTEDELTETKCK